MNTPKILITGLALLPLSGLAAENVSYTYAEVAYINLDVDNYGDGNFIDDFDDGGGFSLRGSYGFDGPVDAIDTMFVFANYSETEADTAVRDASGIFFPADTDVIRLDLGVGAAMPVNDQADLVVRAAYTDLDIDDFHVGGSSSSALSDLTDDSSDGYFLDASLRGQIMPEVELSGGVRYTDIEDVDGFSFVGNAMYEINQNIGINLFADLGSDVSQWGLGARYSF